MKSIKTLLVAAVAAAGLGTAFEAPAQEKHGFRGGHGGRHHGGNWHGHRHWHGPRIGLSIGVPLAFGYGWYGDPWFYGPPVVYREREVIREVEPPVEPASTEIPRGEGAPSQGPLYMNYCESAKAYFPKVQRCPEGWKFIAPNQ